VNDARGASAPDPSSGAQRAGAHAQQQGQGRATPSDIVAALRGASSVTLHGFSQQVRGPSLLRPGVQFVSPAIDAEELRGVLAARSKRIRVLLWIAIAFSHVALALTVALLVRGQASSGAPATAAWSAVAVRPAAVLVRVGEGDGAPVFPVAVGARLPNGEVLTMVDVSRAMYATDRGRVYLNTVPSTGRVEASR